MSGCVCVCVCVCVRLSICLSGDISALDPLFVLKSLSRTQQATKIKTFVGSLKPELQHFLHCTATCSQYYSLCRLMEN